MSRNQQAAIMGIQTTFAGITISPNAHLPTPMVFPTFMASHLSSSLKHLCIMLDLLSKVMLELGPTSQPSMEVIKVLL